MVCAEWDNEKWQTSKKIIRTLKTLSLECEVRTTTNKESKTARVLGRGLETLTLEFTTAISAGGDPIKEQKALDEECGKSAPFYCGSEQIGDNDFVLTSAQMNGTTLTARGDIISANFSLAFIEDAKQQEQSESKAKDNETNTTKQTPIVITYEGKNIAPSISIQQLYLTSYADGHADGLELHFNDTSKNWDKWAKNSMQGKEISVEYGAMKSGKMFIQKCEPAGGEFVLTALSVPPDYNATSTKSWEKITLEELAKEIAGKHGLSVKTYNLKGKKWEYVQQNNAGDFAFLQTRLELEGACMVTYDGVLNVYEEKTQENASPASSAEIDIDKTQTTYAESKSDTWGAYCEYTVTNGKHKGTAKDTNTASKATRTEPVKERIASDVDCKDIATARLRKANKNSDTIVITTDLKQGLSAGSVIKVTSKSRTNVSGNYFVYKIRHNFLNNKSKMWARKPLDY